MIEKLHGFTVFVALVLLPISAHAQLTVEAPALESSPVITSPFELQQARIRGITDTLMAYPQQTPQILSNYIGIDTSKIDLDKFMTIVNSGDYQQVSNEVSVLYDNREAINNGIFQNSGYYKTAEQPVVETPTPPAPNIAPTDTTKAEIPQGAHYLSNTAFYGGLGVIAVGAAGAAAFGGGGDGGTSHSSSTNSSGSADFFNRAPLPDLFDPDDFVDAEFTSYPLHGLERENAQYAYAKGLTGLGVKIGFYDVFSDDSSTDPELNSRIIYRDLNIPADTAYLAADCAASGGNPNACNHGGAVMGYAANARNGVDTQGVAYNASLLMNSAFATINARPLADQGADIINFSCTGCATLSDVQYIAAQGVLMTSATGNSDGPNPNSGSPAIYAGSMDYQLLAVTGVYSVGGILTAAGYDKCGLLKEYCLAAYTNQGTSFSAPQVAGAAALVKEGWSYLTAKQIGEILLYSAQDIGAVGVDTIFGHGLLDIQAAVEPLGTLSVLNGHSGVVGFAPSVINQNQNSAFGDAFSNVKNAKGNIVAVDSFGRDFAVKTQDNLVVAHKEEFSPSMMHSIGKKNDVNTVRYNDRLSMQFGQEERSDGGKDFLGYSEYDLNPSSKLTLGFSNSMDAMAGQDAHPFNKNDFISRDVFQNGFLNLSDNNHVYYQGIELNPDRHVKTKFSTYYSKNSENDYFKPLNNQVTGDYASSVAENIFTPLDDVTVNVKSGMTHEFDSVLGTRFSGSFDMEDGSDTYFGGIDVSYNLSPTLNIFASYLSGSTQAKPAANSAFSSVSDILSDSFSVTATRSELMGHDKLSFSVGQPTRVRSGSVSGMTQQVDRATGAITTAEFQQSLVPSGRTLLFQAAYQKELGQDIDMNFAVEYTHQPYQNSDAGPEASALLKLTYAFN